MASNSKMLLYAQLSHRKCDIDRKSALHLSGKLCKFGKLALGGATGVESHVKARHFCSMWLSANLNKLYAISRTPCYAYMQGSCREWRLNSRTFLYLSIYIHIRSEMCCNMHCHCQQQSDALTSISTSSSLADYSHKCVSNLSFSIHVAVVIACSCWCHS